MSSSAAISPDILKLLICLAGSLAIYSIHAVVESKISDTRYEAVYGEIADTPVTPEREDLVTLPIVVSIESNNKQDDVIATDAMIEQAFKIPEAEKLDEIEVVNKVVPSTVTASELLKKSYNPSVSAISTDGAVINGVFWQRGESVTTMPIRFLDGVIRHPVLSSLSRAGVNLSIGGDSLFIAFATQ